MPLLGLNKQTKAYKQTIPGEVERHHCQLGRIGQSRLIGHGFFHPPV